MRYYLLLLVLNVHVSFSCFKLTTLIVFDNHDYFKYWNIKQLAEQNKCQDFVFEKIFNPLMSFKTKYSMLEAKMIKVPEILFVEDKNSPFHNCYVSFFDMETIKKYYFS